MKKFIQYTILSLLICLGQLQALGQTPPSVSVALLQDAGCNFPFLTTSGFGSTWTDNINSNWQSTDGSVEVWESGNQSVTAYEGARFTEINSYGAATFAQQFSSPGAGVTTTIKFAHRGRAPFTNTIRVSIGPFGGSYTTLGDYTTGVDAWVLYSANYTFPSTGNYEIRFEVLSPLGDGRGNFLDAVSISTSAINTTVSGGTSTTAFITPFTTCAGTASTAQSFPVSGKNLTANLVVTAPTGYEVSLSSGSGYASSVSITPTSGTVESTNVWVRLTSSASNGASGNVTVTSTGAVTQNVATGAGTVTSVTAGVASSTPTVCVNTALTNITHTTTGATGIGTATGLPAGVTANWSSNTITISGTPTASGTYSYSIPLSGGCSDVSATGGTVVDYTEGGVNYRAHTFTSSGTLTVSAGGSVEYLVVGGGGGGGNCNGGSYWGTGGGGGGGVLTGSASVTPQSYSITVGAGGGSNTKGSNSVFSTVTAEGGGYGGNAAGLSNRVGGNGGSGGGGGGYGTVGGSGTAGQGNNGGTGTDDFGGGGGGAGSVGATAPASSGGNGGAGIASAISGTNTFYGGGGAGGYSGSTGGSGGGGNFNVNGTNGQGGGGGGGAGGASGASGGSGIVVVRYVLSTAVTATGTITVNDCIYYGGSGDGYAMMDAAPLAAPLPVTWLEFTGELVKEGVRLNWQTANEQNTSHFDVERSANGGEYTRIGRVQAAGNSANIRSYEFWDETPPTGVLLYRLRQVDIDARYSYSKVVMLRNTAKSIAKIGPNPTGGAFTLQIPADWGSNVEWRFYNTQGQLLEQRSKMVSGNYTIDLSARAAGTYQLTLWKNGELAQKEWIIRR